jgi:Sulfotransferase family
MQVRSDETSRSDPDSGRGARGPIFIIGMPRSGTKLLRGLLNQNPKVRVPDIETEFFPHLVRWVEERGKPESELQFRQMFEAFRGATYFSHRAAERPPFEASQWRDWCDRFDASGLFEGFIRYETGTPRDQDLIWGDKSPGYTRHVGLLLEHFPDARIIHMVRDVRDYCASIRKAWSKDVRRAAFQWGRDVAAAHRVCAHHDRCIEIHYERLLQDPQPQMKRLCAFLELDYSDAMTRLRQPAEHRGEATGRTEIMQDNTRKFLDRLSRREIQDIESLALPTMQDLGYEPLYARRARTMTRLEQQLRRARDGWYLVLSGKSRLGLAGALRFHMSHARLTQ